MSNTSFTSTAHCQGERGIQMRNKENESSRFLTHKLKQYSTSIQYIYVNMICVCSGSLGIFQSFAVDWTPIGCIMLHVARNFQSQ